MQENEVAFFFFFLLLCSLFLNPFSSSHHHPKHFIIWTQNAYLLSSSFVKRVVVVVVFVVVLQLHSIFPTSAFPQNWSNFFSLFWNQNQDTTVHSFIHVCRFSVLFLFSFQKLLSFFPFLFLSVSVCTFENQIKTSHAVPQKSSSIKVEKKKEKKIQALTDSLNPICLSVADQ